jgi:carboxyl-terminal processing protease
MTKTKAKKIQSFLTIFALIGTFTPTITLASFKDVNENHPQYESISDLENQGIINGYNGFFMPDKLITRAELLKMIFSHVKFHPPVKTVYTKFKDVPPESWFAPYVGKALELGALNINPDIPLFYPVAPISKIEALKMIMTIEGIPIPYAQNSAPLIFIDINPNTSFAYLVRAAQNSGLYLISKDKKFLPFKNLTRAEAAELIFLAEQYMENGTNNTIVIQSESNLNPYTDIENKLLDNAKFPIFLNAWSKINNQYIDKNSIDTNKLVYGAINGMVNSLDDPYSVFDTPSDAKNLQDSLEGSYEGIGTIMDKFENDYIIISVVKDSPAEKAGLKSGDIIKQVDGKIIKDLSSEELVNLIKGPADSQVEITIDRNGQKQTFKITRQKVTLDSVVQQQSQIKIPDTIGLISISQFSNSTDTQFEDILNDTMSKKPKALIIDLRDNPGGYLDPTYNILGHFVEKGKPIMHLNISGQEITQNSQGAGELNKIPMAVLVNKNTASAAEVVAACLQDYKTGTLIGEQSYGKGTVQEVTTYQDGSLLKLSVAKWFSPLKRSINKIGLTPDIIVKATKDDIIGKTDTQLQRAIDELSKII